MNGLEALLADTTLSSVWDVVQLRGMDFFWNVVGALAIFFIGRWATKLLTRISEKALRRAHVDETLTRFLGNIVYVVLLLVVVMAALGVLGVPMTSFAAILAAAGLAVGMALKDSLGNFAAGVMIILFRPFSVGNFINAGGAAGTVEEIHIFHTLLNTIDNVRVIVPNGTIINGSITNFSINPTRRIDLVVGCGYEDDLKAVKHFLDSVVASDERILAEPKPDISVQELADSSVNFVVRPWVKSADYWTTRCDLTERIKLGFDELGFHIPYPSRDVHLHNV